MYRFAYMARESRQPLRVHHTTDDLSGPPGLQQLSPHLLKQRLERGRVLPNEVALEVVEERVVKCLQDVPVKLVTRPLQIRVRAPFQILQDSTCVLCVCVREREREEEEERQTERKRNREREKCVHVCGDVQLAMVLRSQHKRVHAPTH